MGLNQTARHEALDGIVIDSIGLHSADPGVNGTDNEVTGDGYTRQSATFAAAAGDSRNLSEDVDFSGPALQEVAFFSLWEGATYKGSIPRESGDAAFNASGEYRLTTAVAITGANAA